MQGRWISPDPAGIVAVDPSNPQTWNRYAYVMNNPLSYVDPLGLVTPGPDLENIWWFGITGQLWCTENVLLCGTVRIPYRLPDYLTNGSTGGTGNQPQKQNPANNGPGFLTKLNTCVVNNAKNYGIGGAANLIFNTQIPGSSLASNSITDAYTLFTGQDGLLS